MIINKCYLKDIRDYEDKTGKNILSLFENYSILNLIEIMQAMKPELTEENCIAIIDNHFNNGGSIDEIFLELRNVLVGYEIIGDGTKDSDEGQPVENIENYKTLTDFYIHLSMQLMALGINYSEFWSITTKEMYQIFNAIQQKSVMDFNKNMQEYHIFASLIAGAIWGKPAKEAPHIDINDLKDNEEIIDTPYGEMSRADYKVLLEMMKLDTKAGLEEE